MKVFIINQIIKRDILLIGISNFIYPETFYKRTIQSTFYMAQKVNANLYQIVDLPRIGLSKN